MCCSILSRSHPKSPRKCIAPSLPMWFQIATIFGKTWTRILLTTAATGRHVRRGHDRAPQLGGFASHRGKEGLLAGHARTGSEEAGSSRLSPCMATSAGSGPPGNRVHALTALLAGLVIGHHRSEDQLKFLAYHDPLTNLLNRRGFFNEAIKLGTGRRIRPSTFCTWTLIDSRKSTTRLVK